jgi:hypothetical protein
MRPSYRYGALLVALLAGFGLAAADKIGRGASAWSEAVALLAADDETTGTIGLLMRDLPLTDEQRGRIFDIVMNMPDAPVAAIADPDDAARLPGSVALQDLPAGVSREIPQVEGYKFVKLDDRILLVSPTSRIVVAMIPIYRIIQ